MADWESVLANLREPVTAVKALRAVILRPHADIERGIVRLEPLDSRIEQQRAETLLLVCGPNVELAQLACRRLEIRNRQLAVAGERKPHGRLTFDVRQPIGQA